MPLQPTLLCIYLGSLLRCLLFAGFQKDIQVWGRDVGGRSAEIHGADWRHEQREVELAFVVR